MDHLGELSDAMPELVPQLPGPGRPPSTTRRQIQEIALEMFSAQGYDQVTIEALAAAAGISRRTFFRYFPAKADTLMADFDQDVERLRLALRYSDPRLGIMAAIRRAVVAVNSYQVDDLAHLRQRLQLQSDHPALLANAIMHYERWQDVVAQFAADRLGQPAEALVPQVIARAAFGAAYAGFMSWLCEDAGALGPKLDAALAALAEGLGDRAGTA